LVLWVGFDGWSGCFLFKALVIMGLIGLSTMLAFVLR
jgi:hypothetical protein